MRSEKLEFNRNVGGVKDKSWISLSEGDQSYELAVRTDLERGSDNYTEWNTADIDDPGYLERNIEVADADHSSIDGFRTLRPGTSRQVRAPFSINNGVHEGLLGEIQASTIYQNAEEHIDSEDINLYDFIEWYQDEPRTNKDSLVKIGPELCFGVEDSGLKESLTEYTDRHALDGARLQLGLDSDVVGALAENESRSVLRQSGLEAVNGILTKNPEEVREMVSEK